MRLDARTLGFASSCEAAAALLEGVAELAGEECDPLICVLDQVAMVARPSLLGCWPALYHALCQVVLQHGSPSGSRSASCTTEGLPFSLLLSQVRPLLERWHGINMDEHSLGYLNEEGTFLRLNKLKHMVNALLQWRRDRETWRHRGRRAAGGSVDEALRPRLKFLPGCDLLLCYPPGSHEDDSAAAQLATWDRRAAPSMDEGLDALRRELQQELHQNQMLKAENELLWSMQPSSPYGQQAILIPFICLPLPAFFDATFSSSALPPP